MEGDVGGFGRKRRPLGLLKNAMKRKDGFVQLFLMTGILMLSLRSLGQKYRINELSNDTADLRGERDALAYRMKRLKEDLRREAEGDTSGILASHLNTLFRDSSE
ncbi:uncharacterized protein [Typha latifolia]|uniref:uncharacterized protein n=1 Tax=Typha latifolia TaxID=4733 RepID=UPI003C2D2749